MVKRHFLSLQHNYYDMPIQKFTLYQYVKEEYELLEYVSLLAQIYTPDFDFDEEVNKRMNFLRLHRRYLRYDIITDFSKFHLLIHLM